MDDKPDLTQFGIDFARQMAVPLSVFVIILLALIAFALFALWRDRRRQQANARAFLAFLDRWPGLEDHELRRMVDLARFISKAQLAEFDLSPELIRKQSEFYAKYSDRLLNPFSYDHHSVVRAVAVLAPESDLFLNDGNEERHVIVDRVDADTLTLRGSGVTTPNGSKVKLTYLGHGKAYKLKARIVDRDQAIVRVYAERSESHRKFARVEVPETVLTLKETNQEVPVINFSIKFLLLQTEGDLGDAELAGELRIPAPYPATLPMTIRRYREVRPGMTIFTIVRIADADHEKLVGAVFKAQQRQ